MAPSSQEKKQTSLLRQQSASKNKLNNSNGGAAAAACFIANMDSRGRILKSGSGGDYDHDDDDRYPFVFVFFSAPHDAGLLAFVDSSSSSNNELDLLTTTLLHTSLHSEVGFVRFVIWTTRR